VWDHIFTRPNDRNGDAVAACDPMLTLGAVAGASDHLELQTVVMNSAWIHPGLLLRQFAQLAVFIGGERVTAGLGVGWNTQEFAALGLAMAPFQQRMSYLEEALRIARGLFDEGVANVDGQYVSAHDLPLSPKPQRPPRLLVGGGSARLLELAGRYCDVLDMHGDPRHGALRGKTFVDKHDATVRAIALTTVDDHVRQVAQVREASISAGRPADSVKMSVQLQHLIVCARSEVRQHEERLCSEWAHIPYRPLDQAPAILVGEPEQMVEILAERADRFALDQIVIKEGSDWLRFCREVLPRMHRSAALTH
jgi:alkanesulfonate monooxygenase SsuD/methylene tetrahydromethanopterin reductase-like flavin-dependent oxidoreductase (luciferase family)